MTTYTVTDADDLQGSKLSDAGRDRVLQALATSYDVILWVESFVIRENEWQTLSGSSRLVPIDGIEHDSGDGLLVRKDGEEVWVGKSVCEVYERNGEVDTSGVSQAFLGDYDG